MSQAPECRVVPIERAQKQVLANLFELYAHDFSEHVPVPMRPDGRFFDGPLDEWWEPATGCAFFIRADDQLAGFALVGKGSAIDRDPDVMDVAEFFVLRGWRRHGLGRSAAHALFKRFAGPWEVRCRESNGGALRFWQSAVSGFTGDVCEGSAWTAKGVEWQVFRFDSARAGRVRA